MRALLNKDLLKRTAASSVLTTTVENSGFLICFSRNVTRVERSLCKAVTEDQSGQRIQRHKKNDGPRTKAFTVPEPEVDAWAQGVTISSDMPSQTRTSNQERVRREGAANGVSATQQTSSKINKSESSSKSSAKSLTKLVATAVKGKESDQNQAPAPSSAEREAFFEQYTNQCGLTAQQKEQLLKYIDYMLETNKVMNLTAIRDRSEALTRHVVDSLSLLPVIDSQVSQHLATPNAKVSNALTIIDVGTGAGLPGMVLAIARPQWKITLLDTLRKRCDFLQRSADMNGLKNVRVVWSRAEDGARKPELREGFDLATARAVADTRVLAELCVPYVKPGGLWIAPKGPEPHAEVSAAKNAITKLGGSLISIEPVQAYPPDGGRTAVVVKKARSTPPAYPRNPGTPNKSPL